MKLDNLIAGIILFIIVIAAFTSPNHYWHKEMLKSKLYSDMQEVGMAKIPGLDDNRGRTSESLQKLLDTELINNVVDTRVITKNYGLFSTSSIFRDGQTKVIAIGAFGHVFYTSGFDETTKLSLLNGD